MAITNTLRFTVEPSDTEELLRRRATLIETVRGRFPGLTEARLARVDDTTWVDSWRWRSPEDLQRAADAALPEAAAAFELTRDVSQELGEVVDER
jgi:hypothetical protein